MQFSDKLINFRTPLQHRHCDNGTYFKICIHNVLCLLKSTSQSELSALLLSLQHLIHSEHLPSPIIGRYTREQKFTALLFGPKTMPHYIICTSRYLGSHGHRQSGIFKGGFSFWSYQTEHNYCSFFPRQTYCLCWLLSVRYIMFIAVKLHYSIRILMFK